MPDRENEAGPLADAVVFFGATGDLAHKQIFPALYGLTKRGMLDVPVVGVARSGWDLERFRLYARDAVEQSEPAPDQGALDRLLGRLRYVDGDYGDTSTFLALKDALTGVHHPVHYLAIPPSLFGLVVTSLGAAGLADGSRVIIEKPFGRDLASARRLNASVRAVFPEESIFRIDHFLGKEAVENLLYVRFANSFLEPIWNRNQIANVQITMAEDFGLQGREKFYEGVGCLRDVVENHLFQVVSLLAMEPPSSLSSTALRHETARVMRSLVPLQPSDLVRGQFAGYRDLPGVAGDSDVETYCALRLTIDSWRWAGVPWYLRAGKRLPLTATEIVVQFKGPPTRLFQSENVGGDTNYLRLRIAPHPAIALAARVKTHGQGFAGEQRELLLQDTQSDEQTAYERLIGDAMAGRSMLFTSEETVEAAWAAVDATLRNHERVEPYEPGSWGPVSANDLLDPPSGWHNPVLAAGAGAGHAA